MYKQFALIALLAVTVYSDDTQHTAPDAEEMSVPDLALCTQHPHLTMCHLPAMIEQALVEIDEVLMGDEGKQKRKSAFVRFGKRKSAFVRFGKRKSSYVRFG